MNRNSMTEYVTSYIRSKIKIFVFFLIFILIFSIIFSLYRINTDAVLYASILCGVICIIYSIYDFYVFFKRLEALEYSRRSITISTDHLPGPSNAVEQRYRDLIDILFEDLKSAISDSHTAKAYMSDYYAMWVHQIKTPISAMHMLLQDEPKSSPLNIELFKIEQYVEMVLSYIRLESDHTDYVIKQCRLDDIVKQAVRKYAPLFIAKKISINIADIDIIVNTDEKWLQLVIEQILSNSLKYTKSGSISIECRNPKILVIKDTGIGIAPEDIPRIGEKGFTGYNGHMYKKSTGLGLYLCKEILKRLSHSMEIRSHIGKGTEVSISLGTRDIIIE